MCLRSVAIVLRGGAAALVPPVADCPHSPTPNRTATRSHTATTTIAKPSRTITRLLNDRVQPAPRPRGAGSADRHDQWWRCCVRGLDRDRRATRTGRECTVIIRAACFSVGVNVAARSTLASSDGRLVASTRAATSISRRVARARKHASGGAGRRRPLILRRHAAHRCAYADGTCPAVSQSLR